MVRKPRWRTRDIRSLIYPRYGYPWCTRPSTQALLYLVPSKYLFLPSLRAHSSEITYLSSERFCLKFGRFFAEILKSEYQEILPWSPIHFHPEIYRVLKVKNRKFSQSFLCNENCIDIFWVSPLTAHVDSKFLAMHNETLRHMKTSRFSFSPSEGNCQSFTRTRFNENFIAPV